VKRRADAEAIEALTRRMFTRIIAAFARTLVDEDMSVVQIAALYLIDDRGVMRIGEVASEIARPLASVSRAIDALVRRGLIVRKEDPDDRRARVLALAPKGKSFLDRAGDDRVRTVLDAASSLPPAAMAQMLDIARKLR
jgi:DNA-binding MarR family transcriptional regulator